MCSAFPVGAALSLRRRSAPRRHLPTPALPPVLAHARRLTLRARRAAAPALAALALACAGAALAAPTAAAQTVGTIRYDGGGYVASQIGYDVGRIDATILALGGRQDLAAAIDVFCVDRPNYVKFQPWQAYFTNLGGTPSLEFTRQNGVLQGKDLLTTYRRAAWLVDQFGPGRTALQTVGIQAAIWAQFDTPMYTLGDEVAETQYWMDAVDAFAASPERWNAFDFGRFTVVTDVDGVGRAEGGAQEFITPNDLPPTTTTPEPATVALLGAGLAGLAVVARRRAARA